MSTRPQRVRHDLERRLVGLVDDERAAVARRAHERRVLPHDDAAAQARREREALHRRVAVQLHVLALGPEALEQPIRHLVAVDRSSDGWMDRLVD